MGNVQTTHLEIVDFESFDFGATDYKSANCDGAERESTDCNCANGQRSD